MNTSCIRGDSPLAREFWQSGRSESCPIYNMHGHMGPMYGIYFPRADVDQMIHSMDQANVRLLCFAHHSSLFSGQIGNAPSVEAVRKYPHRLRAYLSVIPHFAEATRRDLAAFDAMRDVFVGLKFLADYHGVALSDDRYRAALELADARKIPVLLHTWGSSKWNGSEQVRLVAGRFPHATFLLGHCFNDRWHEAIAVANDLPNTYLELTSVLGARGVLELFAEKVGSHRLLFGTDLPWFNQHHAIGSLLSADITDDDRHNICHRNAEQLLGHLLPA
jgi:uncharacterized protein